MENESRITESELAELIAVMDEAAGAYIRGDLARYCALFDHADDYTLMPPLGGDTRHGFEFTPERAQQVAETFRSGEARLDVQQSYVSGDLAVLVAVERQHGEVAGTPDQDWSLRVTLVFRRVGDRWELAHRHADPLVREIGWDQFAGLARGT